MFTEVMDSEQGRISVAALSSGHIADQLIDL
jgi:hypothetical protein